MDNKTRKAIAFLSFKVAIIGLVAFVTLHFLIAIRICRGSDMYPNLHDGDLVIIQKTHDPAYDDVILYEHDGIEYFGRVIAVAGERVTIDSRGGVRVNDNTMYDQLPYSTTMPDGSRGEFSVKEGEVFVLGDFRDGARDSREFGCVKSADTIGRQIYQMRWRGF